MIKIKKGKIEIAGTNGELLLETNELFYHLLQLNPELIIGVVTGWSSVLQDSIESTDSTILSAIVHASENIAKQLTEWGNKDEN